MPIYEYECTTCKNTKEVLQSINTIAPTCCNNKMRKLISNSTFQLKGTGWYVTDYKNSRNNRSGSVVKDKGK